MPSPVERRTVPLLIRPLLFYVAVTLGVPLANGAGLREPFWHHAWITLGIVVVLSLLAAGLVRSLGWVRAPRRTR